MAIQGNSSSRIMKFGLRSAGNVGLFGRTLAQFGVAFCTYITPLRGINFSVDYFFCIYYLRQVNEVNGGDSVFVRCVSVCLCVRSGRSWELNANSSKTVKATDFRSDIRVPRDSPDMTPKISQKRAWPGSRDPLNFWALNANSSKMVKATDFKFHARIARDSSDMTSKNFPKRGRGQSHVTP